MKALLNTLYVTTQDAYVSKDGFNVVVAVDGIERFRIPIMNIESILTFGYQGASPGVMRLCADNGVNLSFFSPTGRFISRVQGPKKGNILLRKRQFEVLDDMEEKIKLASRFIYGKLYNSRVVLRRFIREYPTHLGVTFVESAADHLKRLILKLNASRSLDVIRGIEGDGAACYFGVFSHLILNSEAGLVFDGRNRRPPTDPINALLSFGYSLLANDCASALEGVGLDPAAGFMHTLRPGRSSLALDLMEELRAYMVDRFVLSIVNNRQLSVGDFKIYNESDQENPVSVILTEEGRKKFLTSWQNRKKIEFTHPFLEEKIKIGLLPHIQAMMLARYLRKDIDDYPMFLMK